MPGPAGPLAIAIWEPPEGVPCRFVTLHVPAAVDEMNKSRRMVALQARAFAAIGGTTAVVDLRGTGDSGGGHGEATWQGWHDDVSAAWQWLAARSPGRSVVWGLRLGGLLAADLVSKAIVTPDALALWQPAVSGRGWFNQFLRLATVQQVTGALGDAPDAKALRAALTGGSSVEVAGYDVNPALIGGAEAVDLSASQVPACAVIWREVSSAESPQLGHASAKVVGRWQATGSAVDAEAIAGPSFWAAQEIEEAPELIASTTHAVARRFAIHIDVTTDASA